MAPNALEAELDRARELSLSDLADAIESIGFECTRCGACCTREDGNGCGEGDEEPVSDDEEADAKSIGDDHTATVFPDEVRRLLETDDDAEWRDVARPMPYGLRQTDDGAFEGETFEWALQTDSCGDCTFYDERDGTGACTAHANRPLICRTYPFSVALAGTSQPMGEAVDTVALPARGGADDSPEQRSADHSSGQRPREEAGDEAGTLRAHECEGLGRDISREDAEDLARALRVRAIRELEEAISVGGAYEPANPGPGEVVVHDSEGAKRTDGSPYGDER